MTSPSAHPLEVERITIVCEEQFEPLVARTNALLRSGWLLYGNLCICGEYAAVALVKLKDPADKTV
jgi:hypothetical protein